MPEAQGASSSSTVTVKSPWLDAMSDPVAGMVCFSPFMCLCDLHADGNHRLILVDMQKRIRIYKGTTIQWEQKLMDVPVGVSCFFHENKTPSIPTLAVASGHQIFVYRYLRPHLKYTLPKMEINATEISIWSSIRPESVGEAMEKLNHLRDQGIALTNRSMDLLAMEDQPESERMEYVKAAREHPFMQNTAITCMDTLNVNIEDPSGVAMLTFGAENRHVYILDSNALDIVQKVELESVPVFLVTSGLYEVEYRLICACRDGKVYTVKNGALLSMVIELETLPVGLVKIDKSIYVGCMDNVVHCFHFKGKKQHSIYLDHPITCMQLMQSPKTKAKCLLVALKNGEVRTYNGKFLVHTLALQEPVVGMCFGMFGREDGTLCLSMKSGGLVVKMLSRTANLEKSSQPPGPPAEQDTPLDVPKKTKLYVDQTAREREQPVEMHRIFQRDLCKLRLNTARAYVKLLGTSGAVVRTGAQGVTQLRLNAGVKGMGPEFELDLQLSNAGERHVMDLCVQTDASGSIYRIDNPLIHVPLLVPGYTLSLPVRLECVDVSASDTVTVSVLCRDTVRPLVSALVQMPISAANMLED
ncbi:unnamed protein product [Amoebophrya sp. A25]|nr:unnamed protein product [Amoebophrya sp. A25]|eukprot:GSA25T00013411001.1